MMGGSLSRGGGGCSPLPGPLRKQSGQCRSGSPETLFQAKQGEKIGPFLPLVPSLLPSG